MTLLLIAIDRNTLPLVHFALKQQIQIPQNQSKIPVAKRTIFYQYGQAFSKLDAENAYDKLTLLLLT